MTDDYADGVRSGRAEVFKHQAEETDTNGPGYARSWRRLWLWPSYCPTQRPTEAMDRLLPTIARAMYRDSVEREALHSSDLKKAQTCADEGLAIAGDALLAVEAHSRTLTELVALVEKHGFILERITKLMERGSIMVPPMDAAKMAKFEAEWAAALSDNQTGRIVSHPDGSYHMHLGANDHITISQPDEADSADERTADAMPDRPTLTAGALLAEMGEMMVERDKFRKELRDWVNEGGAAPVNAPADLEEARTLAGFAAARVASEAQARVDVQEAFADPEFTVTLQQAEERLRVVGARLNLPPEVMALPIPAEVRQAIERARAVLGPYAHETVVEPTPEQAMRDGESGV